MFLFGFLISIAFLLAAAANAVSSDQVVWAVAAFVMAGEYTPLLGGHNNLPTLTADGAQQMLSQGQAFRARYLLNANDAELPQYAAFPRATLHGMSADSLDQSQMVAMATRDGYIAASALAFLQGLFPPTNHSVPADAGGLNISFSTGSGQLSDYPLGGYQYPTVLTLDPMERESIL